MLLPKSSRVGWIGTGVMGDSMCGHLLRGGFQVTLYNRTKSKAQSLLEMGATWADSPFEVAQQSDVVISIVGYPADVRATTFGPNGTLQGIKEGGVLVDMTTSEPSLAAEIAIEAAKKNVVSIDAPVSGGDIGARDAKLSIMVGGDAATFEYLTPIWNLMGKTILYQGGPGAGQHCKLANQILVAGVMVSLCEAMLYTHRTGGNLDSVLQAVSSGAATSWGLVHLGPKIISGDYAPGFYVEHFSKDLGIVLAECQKRSLNLPGLSLAEELYRNLRDEGDGRLGTQALIRSLRRLNGMPPA